MDSLVPVSCIIPVAGASSRMGRFKPLLPWGDSTIISTVVARALATRSLGLDMRIVVVTGNRAAEIESELDIRHGLSIREGYIRFVHNEAWEAGQTGSIQRGMAILAAERAEASGARVSGRSGSSPGDATPGSGADGCRVCDPRSGTIQDGTRSTAGLRVSSAFHGVLDAEHGIGTPDTPRGMDGLQDSMVHRPVPEDARKAGYFFVMLADMPLAASGVYAELDAEAARRGAGGEAPVALFPAWEGRAGHPVLVPFGFIPALLRLPPDAKMRPCLEMLGAMSVPTACEGVTIDIDTEEAYLRYAQRP